MQKPSGMMPDRPPYFYVCNVCGERFLSGGDVPPVPVRLPLPFLRPKCPRCGSRNVREDFIIRK